MFTSRFDEEFTIPFIKRLMELRDEKGSRAVAFLAGPPAAGKSTLAEHIERVSLSVPGLSRVQALPMDGFHRRQEYLLTHFTERNGRVIPLVEIKGAPETFDTEKLNEAVRRLAAGDVFGFPTYDRALHNPTENGIEVTSDIVLVEGIYMLLDMPGFDRLRDSADITVFINAQREMLLERLINRKLAGGKSYEYARQFALSSDMVNAELILEKSAPADIVIDTDAEGNMSLRA